MLFFYSCCLLLAIPSTAQQKEDIGLDTAKIEELTGVKGSVDEEEKVFKISIARDDINLSINGLKIPPSAGLSSWVAFKRVGKKTLAMGDFLLLQDQVNPIISTVLDNGLEITALHNHFMWEHPRVMYMHIKGVEDQDKLASAIGTVLTAIKETTDKKDDDLAYSINPKEASFDTSKLDEIFGVKGVLEKGVYKIVVGNKAKMDDSEIGKNMGLNSWAAFMGSDKLAVADGDLAVKKRKLQRVLHALNKAKINITAIHQHMLDDKPHYLYVHFYGIGKSEDLAKGLRTALNSAKNSY